MRFQSTLLTTKTTNNSGYINKLVESDNRPRIYDILEYNSDMQDIDLKYKIAQYRNMVEGVYCEDNNQSLAAFNENIIKTAIDKLVEIVKKIIEFVKNTIKKLFGGYKKEEAVLKEEIDRVEAIDKNDPVWGKRAKFKIFCFPDITSINSGDFVPSLKAFTDPLNYLAEGNDRSEVDDNVLATSYKALFRLVRKRIKSSRPPVSKYESNVVDNKTLKEFTKTELCFIVTEEMTIREWYEKYVKTFALESLRKNCAPLYSNAQSVFLKELDKARKTLENARQGSLSDTIVRKMETTVNYIENIVNAYNGLLSTIQKYHTSSLHYAANVLRSVKSEDSNDFSNNKYHTYKTESGMIHGEEFNSDTLFDNEDERDFNRTEWLDLNLTVECYTMKHKLTEIRKRIAIQEACILADEEPRKIIRLNAMREAEEKKSNNVIMTIINKIKEFFTKFTQTFNEKFNSITKYIHDNKQYIDKPVTIKSMGSKGDIIAGMYRCQNNINVIPFDYNAMKADLVDKKTFFKNKILPTLGKNNQTSKRKLDWTDDMDIATYCKIYFGASMPEENYPKCEYTGAEMEQNKKNIIRFLTEKNISFSAKKDLDNLEHESKRMNASVSTNTPASSGDTNSTTGNASTTSTSSSTSGSSGAATPKGESMYYSELYERWITEADIDAGVAKEGEKPVSTPNNDIYNAYRVYMEAYKDVILAKMTGCEFIISELKQFISVHSVNNGGKPIPSNTKEKKK